MHRPIGIHGHRNTRRLLLGTSLCLIALIPTGAVHAEDPASCQSSLVAPYMNRAALAEGDSRDASHVGQLPPVPADYQPWWYRGVHESMRPQSSGLAVNLETLIVGALKNSSQVRVFSKLPLIRETAITEADAAFDWTAFMETRWDDISEPVGNVLTVGPGQSRFNDDRWTYDYGLRRKNRVGGYFELGQQYGYQRNNSDFFVPNDQGTARLRINYTQPLLQGAGRYYNESLVVLAQIDTAVAKDEFSRQLQSHLLEINRAYWGMYLERGSLLQKKRSLERATEILGELEGRRGVDAHSAQIASARAAVAGRQSELIRAEMAVKNSEARVRALVNDPKLALPDQRELVPLDVPRRDYVPNSMAQSLTTALQYRPEVSQALKQIRAASVRLNMSRNELLPVLNAVVETYVAGLRGDTDIGGAFVDQFSEGAPSYAVGLQFEVPVRRRAAHARNQRRHLELCQLRDQFRTTVETLMLEVEVAVREVNTSYREIQAKFSAMTAAESELEYLRDRWRHLAGENRAATLVLEDVLAAQVRLADAEFDYLSAVSTYNLSLTNLSRAEGLLLQQENVSMNRTCCEGLPFISLDKPVAAYQTEAILSAPADPNSVLQGVELTPAPPSP